MTFPIRRVDRRRAQQPEQMGSKPKYWFYENDQRWLFKAENRGTGEDWAEVVSGGLCGLLSLPHVAYELAMEYDDDEPLRRGVVCRNMARGSQELVLANELLPAFDPDYPRMQRFGVKQHTVEAICAGLATLKPPESQWMDPDLEGFSTALDVFVGYVMFDVLIANQDRHHENWGAIRGGIDNPGMFLAPTFDHGAGFARNLDDRERRARLDTRDRGYSLSAYTRKTRGAVYETFNEPKPMPLSDTFRQFAMRSPDASKYWLDRLQMIGQDEIRAILANIPSERMSLVTKEFTFKLLEINRNRLLALKGIA